MTSTSLRVVIAEDDVLFREGVQALLERFGHHVCATLPSTDGLMQAVDAERPDIVVLDVRMPPTFTNEGLMAALQLRAAEQPVPVLVISQYVEQTSASELLESGSDGGVGYLLKERIGHVREFTSALENVAAGGTAVDPEVVRQLLRRRRTTLDRLTDRERDVLEVMGAGRSNTAIAETLCISEAAVAKHIGNIFNKLELAPEVGDHRRVLAVLAFLGKSGDA